MGEGRLGLNEVKKIVEKFVREHKKINTDERETKQEIEISHIMLGQLENYYEVGGKISNVQYTIPSDFDYRRYSSPLNFHFLDDIFQSKKADSQDKRIYSRKEYTFELKISAKDGEILGYDFKEIDALPTMKDVQPSSHVVGYVSELGESPFKSVMDELDSASKIDAREAKADRDRAQADRDREITADFRDRKKRRNNII